MTQPALTTVPEWRAAERAGRRIGHAIEGHLTVASTNDRALELLDRDDGDGSVVVAEEQTAGRGRRGRTWVSPPGVNLTFSVALRPRLAAREGWQLGLAASLAARSACGRSAEVWLKWPNDLVDPSGRKLGGMLVETSAAGDRLDRAVVGIGINVNWRRASMPDEFAAGATSLGELAGAPIDRVALLAALLDELDTEIARVEAGESPIDRYRAACSTLGTFVSVATPEGTVGGTAVDLDPTASLVVETGDGRRAIASGEVVRVRRPGVPA